MTTQDHLEIRSGEAFSGAELGRAHFNWLVKYAHDIHTGAW